MVYRRSLNFRDLLVRAKLRNPANTAPNQPHDTFRCNSKHGCLTCPHIEDGRTTYTFSNTGEVREIKQHITCKSTNLTYMIECHKCKKQYIGETKRTLRERFTEHRQKSQKNPSHANATAAVPTHFNLLDHSFLSNFNPRTILLVEKLEKPILQNKVKHLHHLASIDGMNTKYSKHPRVRT